MSQRTSATGTQQTRECLLLAAVCDVRGFSTLQNHIDEYIVSGLTLDGRGDEIAKENLNFMASTRKRAGKIFRDSLLRLGQDANQLKYALKSTGDGFLVAVEIMLLEGVNWNRKKYPKHWAPRAWALANALMSLYEDSKRSRDRASLGGMTSRFLRKFGKELGLAKKDYQKRGLFRVPGALAMGSGTITRAIESVRDNREGNRGDAYGHPVNVSFRLCDHAGRFNEETEEISPEVLLDRRVGRLLTSEKPPVDGWVVEPLDRVALKGMEETWCYALRKKKKTRSRRLSAKTRKAK
jgi:hypothetical protein